MADFDAIIIGGGHNGLSCAAHLARAGQRVIVLESRPLVGGFATTETPVHNHPDCKVSLCSMDLVSVNLPPSVIEGLLLPQYGLELIDVDPFYSYVAADGRSFAFWRDVERTCAEIAVFSKNDAAQYRHLTQSFIALWRTISPYLHDHPVKPSLRTIGSMLLKAVRSRKALPAAVRTIFMSPRNIIHENFESDALRSALAIFAAASGSPINEPGSGIIMAMMAMQHEWGVRRPVGGMGAFSDALAGAATAHGAEIRTSSAVQEVLTKDGQAVGVVTNLGDRILGRRVIAAIDPVTLFNKLVPGEILSNQFLRELKSIGVWRANLAAMRVDLILDRLPEFVTGPERAGVLSPTSMLVGPNLETIQSYLTAAANGDLVGEIPIWPAIPSRLDRTLVPKESSLETMYIFVPAVPYRLSGNRSWSSLRDEVAETIIGTLERIMPDVRQRIVGRSVRTPDDIAATSGLHRGNAYHVDMSLAQMGPWRPTRSLSGYRTPLRNLWHTGAGAHPMGSVNGLSGAITAKTILKDKAPA